MKYFKVRRFLCFNKDGLDMAPVIIRISAWYKENLLSWTLCV